MQRSLAQPGSGADSGITSWRCVAAAAARRRPRRRGRPRGGAARRRRLRPQPRAVNMAIMRPTPQAHGQRRAADTLVAKTLLPLLMIVMNVSRAGALDNGAARTPALGWSSWVRSTPTNTVEYSCPVAGSACHTTTLIGTHRDTIF
jgi:hypothetical protein